MKINNISTILIFSTIYVNSSAYAEIIKTPPKVEPRTCPRPLLNKLPENLHDFHGTTVVRLLVNSDGAVTESNIESSSGSDFLDQVVLNADSKCHFSPALIDGIPTPEPEWTTLKYTWSIEPTKH